MKYIKLFEDKEYDKSVVKSNKKLIDLVYAIMSLEEDLKSIGFNSSYKSFDNKVEFKAEYSLTGQHRLDSEYILSNIDKNIDIQIPTLIARINCSIKSSYEEGIIEELDQLIIGLKQRIVDFSPNTRVNTIGRIIEIKDMERYDDGEHKKTKKININLIIELLDRKATRYT